jgi:hypothetical protein
MPGNNVVSASKLKVTAILNVAELLAVSVQDGKPRVVLRVKFPDRELTVDLAAKSVRKAQATIRESGADSVVLLPQGTLAAGDVLAEAGLSAQIKAPKG